MRTTMSRLLTVAPLVLAPTRVAAQPQVYCPPGLFKGCVAVEVRDGAFGTEVRLQNLQGSMGDDDFARMLIQDIWVDLVPTDVWWHASNFDWRGTVDNNVPRVNLDGPAYRGGGPDLEHGRTGPLPIDGFRAAIVEPILHY